MYMLLLESINAITSWENYEYQGHIALYYTLKKIYELIDKKEDIEEYELQIEGEEDFSIRKQSKYITLHQVKAGEINLSANDKFSFIIGILQNDAEYGYYHITNNKNWKYGFVSETLEYISELEKDLKKEVKKRKDIPKGANEDNYIIVEKISSNNKKASAYNIIKYVSKNTKDLSIIKSTIQYIQLELNRYKTMIQNKIKNVQGKNNLKLEDKVFLDVFEEKYDNVKQIRQKAYNIIMNILEKECSEYTFVDIDYATFVYDQLLLYMKKIITDYYIKNNKKNKNEKCILTFKEILEQIKVDYHEKIDTVLCQYYQVLKGIKDAFVEYPNASWSNCNKINCKSCKISKDCNLLKQINILNNKSKEEKNQIIHNLLLKTPVAGKSNNLPQDSLISYLFLNLLDKIKELGLEKNNAYQTIGDENKVYRLTLDNSYSIDEFQSSIKKELGKEIDRTLLYECDVLITEKLNIENIFFNGEDINVLNEKELNEISEMTSTTVEDLKKDCNRMKVIRIIDKKGALGELTP